MVAPDGGPATTDPWSPYGIRTSLDRSAFLVDLATTAERAGLSVEQIHTEYGHDQLEVSLAPDHPGGGRRRRDSDAHRARPGGRPARLANLVRPGAVRRDCGQRGTPAPFVGRRARPAVLRRGRPLRDPPGRWVRHRRRPRHAARPHRRLCGLGAVGAAPQAGQLGWRGGVLGSGEPRSGGAVHRGHAGQPTRRQRRTQTHRPERQPLPGRGGVPGQRVARDRSRARAARRDPRELRRSAGATHHRCPPTSAPPSRRSRVPRSPRSCSPPRSSKHLSQCGVTR